jgi:hypothetical protein
MARTAAPKSKSRSLNRSAPSRPGTRSAAKVDKGLLKINKADVNVTAGGKGDKDGKGDIQAKKAGTSIGKRTASK